MEYGLRRSVRLSATTTTEECGAAGTLSNYRSDRAALIERGETAAILMAKAGRCIGCHVSLKRRWRLSSVRIPLCGGGDQSSCGKYARDATPISFASTRDALCR